ncbi:obscurin-like protein 1 isoform X11 [Gadus macrocephalus]|uniref:obscurin-like protein 1 isoform X11 n=1 Tax=Gadus macrocephalus TaxID=80720 RepID=UPI0028CB7D7F|nr:obscurin-like protein 1 isoform X11 [Gadus macrocephalus]
MDVFGGAPRFLAYPRPVVVQSGTDAVLKCQIGGDPRPAVIWESNNIKIDTQGRYRVFEDGNVYNLIISSVTSEDSGQYICKAKNSIGETYAAATLKVEGEAQELEVREENKPRFLIKPLSTRVGRGDDAVFSCKLWGNPRPDVVWEKDGRKLHEIFESTHFSVGCQDGGWFQLKIFKTRAPDGGVYTCKARNEFGEGLAGAVLLVDAGPGQGDDGNRNGYNNSHWKAQQGKQRSGRLMSNRLRDDGMTKSTKVKMFAVTEGKHAKFRCFVTGKPKPEIIWRKDGRLILSGRRYLCYEDREGYFTLKVLYCKQKDNGVYVCAASNTAGQTLSAVHLTVKEPPVRFKQPLIDLEVWERDLAVLECEVPEDSVPITWYLEDRRLQPGAKYGMEEWGTKRRLTIRDIGVDDDGIYLCEMPDGGRSIAEVAVKGTIVRKLPRKVDVLEGENAAFCVEVEEEEMDIHWYKEGVELRETHQTILKSFGRTHILVFVNTNPQDSGLVMFFVGRSKTSSQLRVKAAKHSPPSCPVSVQINTERANAALLSWVPAQDSRKNPPSGYVLERQEVGTGSQEWLQCLTTDSATSVEILGDSVPCEADYRFRICSVNKYGKSNNVEFPRAVHLVPVARIQAPLQDALVPEGQDACFTIELSASVIGTWFLNGTQLQDDERYTTRRSRTHQSLRIRGVRETDNGAEITFIAYGIRDSAALYIQAPLVKFSPLSEMDRNKFIEEGNPIVLYCELSDPAAPVHWYKNGVELQTTEGLHIQSEGTMRRIVIQSAEFSHSGVYCCDAIDDVIRFNVEVEAPPVKFTPLPDEKRERAIHTGSRMELQCELSDLSATVHWYKDGSKLLPQSGVEMLSDGLSRMLVVDVADFIHSGLYSCKTKGDAITFNVDVTVPPVKFSAIPEQLRNKTIEAGCPIVLQCVVSDPEAQVCWYKGPTQLLSNAELEIQSEGHTRSLVIQFAEPGHSGVYSCASEDDTMEFRVEIRAIPVKFSTSFDVEQTKAFEVGAAFELECEVTEPTAEVCWYKDGHQLCPQNGWDINSDSSFRRLIVQSAELFHAGRYSCETSDDTIQFTVEVKAPPVRIKAAVCETERNQSCEVSDPCAGVSWYKDGLKLLDLNGQAMGGSEGSVRSLSVESALPYHAAPPVKFSAMSEADQTQTVMVGCPIALLCELSDPTGQVHWSKDGAKLIPPSGVDIQSDGNIRKLTIQSAQRSHSGVYQCETKDDAIQFSVDVKALPLKFCELPEDERSKSVKEGSPLVLRCELCQDTTAEVFWSRDGTQLLPGDIDIQSDGLVKKLCIHSVDRTHAGVYQCSTAGDSITFTVEIKGCSQRIKPIPMSEKFKALSVGSPVVLQCELQDPVAQVSWCKDGVELYSKTGLDMKRNGHVRKLVINSAKASDSGLYSCCLSLDVVTFQVEVQDPAAEVNRYKDVVQPLPLSNFDVQSNDELRSMNIQSAEARHRGLYSCEAMNDIHIESKVDVAAPVWSSMAPEVGRCLAVAEPISQQRETAHLKSRAHLSNEDRVNPLPKCVTISQSEDRKRTVVTQPATSVGSFSGVCNLKTDDVSDFNDCYVEVKVHPVTFVNSPEEERFKSVVEQDQLVLACEVSQADAPVQWYMDGVELQACDNVTMRSADTARTLSIRSARLSDTGTYTCRAGDSALIFKVNIREPPVTIVYPKEDVHLDRHVPEEIILSCELSRPNGVVNWYKDGQKLQESENIKLKVEGPYRRLKLICSRVEDSGEYVCDTADDSIFFHLKITEPPVRIVSPSQSQMELCQQTSERMVLSCEISRANALVRWYRDGLEVEENKNLILEVDGIYRRLIIPETSVQDSAEYVCDTADDSVTFFVNIAEPPVRFMRPRKMASVVERFAGEAMVLDCEVSRANAEVTWKRNGEEVEDSRKVTILEDVVLRQLTVHCLSLEDAGQYVCDAKDDVMDFQVKVKELPVRILGKTDATAEKKFLVSDDIILVCELSRANASVSWYKDSVLIDNDTRVCCEEQGAFRSLVVLSAELEDSGEYSCDAGDDKMLFCITVKEPPVQIIGNSGTPEQHILVAGDDLILECEVSRPNCPVQWLWNSKLLKSEDRIKIDSCDVVRRLVLSGLQPSDSGKYICDAIDDKMITLVEVQQPPVKFVNKQPNNNISACENECVSLCAIVSQERANVRWLKDGRLLNEDNVHISIDGANHNLTINPLKLSNAGVYVCDANTDEMSFTVIVKEIKATFSLPLENITGLKGSMLTLRCELSKPKGDVQWLKNGQEISPSRRHTIRAQGRERSFAIHQLADEDAGEYTCESTDDRTSTVVTVETPRTVEFIAELHNITVREGEDATFKCVVSPEDTHLTWCLNGERVHQDDRLTVISNGLCHTFCIKKCRVSDSARVTADAEGLAVSQANLQVQEQQVLFTKSMAPLTAEEFGEATLEVEVSLDSGEVQWMRQGVLLHPGAKYSLKRKGRKHTLTVHKLAVADRGIYSCESLHDRTQAQLTVEPRKVTINTGLKDIWTTERETASFEVVLSHADVPGSWLRNGVQLKPTKHWRISTKGHVHSLTVSNLAVEDTGSFSFCVENLRTSARLVVREPPVTFLRHLEDQKFPEGSVVSIECELSRHNVDVRWMKNGAEVKPGKDQRIFAMGRKRFLQIMKGVVGDSAQYTCDAADTSTSCTIEIYEREVLVVQGLQDQDIQEDQNAVFVCDLSVEDVPGEWYRNGDRIQPTSSIKIRQEGTKHFLLMVNVRGEDSGEIKFVARHVESVASLKVEELPVNIVNPLQDQTVVERSRVLLDCTVSNPRCSIRWYKGPTVILPSERFEICSEGCYRKLIIQPVELRDQGTYSVQVGEYSCSAHLTVEAQSVVMVRPLEDVEVGAPGDACFQCEISHPVLRAPVWSLRGEQLQPSATVFLEKMGPIHRLTLRETAPDMSGEVGFTLGPACSTAKLTVRQVIPD